MHANTARLLSVALALAALPALAHQEPPRLVQGRSINYDTYTTALLQASGHPNELNRWHGIWAYDNGRFDAARQYFERAAAYGDKLSQHMLTLMYWHGEGIDRDPALAYVWADLAAERANNADLLQIRERIWGELSPAQQQQAMALGAQYYAKYGDDVARRRADAELRRFMRTQTGSRVGLLTSRLEVNAGRPDLWASGAPSNYGPLKTSGGEFYADSRTRPAAYWQSEDLSVRALLRQLGTGRVDVGEVRKVPTETNDVP